MSIARDGDGRSGRLGTTAAVVLLCGWFAFLALAGLDHQGYRRLADDFREGRVRFPAEVVRLVRAYPADDGDIRRAWAYSRAALGLSYPSFYVRPVAAWEEAFARGEDASPDQWPEVTPGHALRPWRDYLVEYPPGYFLSALPLALIAQTPDQYRKLFVIEMAICALLSLWLADRMRRRAAPGAQSVWRWGALTVPLMGLIVTHRTDALVLLGLTVLVWAAANDRPGWGGAITGLLFATKGVPAIAAAVLLLPWVRARKWSAVASWCATAVASALVVILPAVAVGGAGLLDAARYQTARPLQVESTAAAALGLLRLLAPGVAAPVQSHGATAVVGPWAEAAAGLSLTLLVLGWIFVHWQASRRSSAPASAASSAMLVLVLWMVLGKIFSPQFFVWVLALALLAGSLAGGRALLALAFICALGQVVYPGSHESLRELAPWACAVVLVRNAALTAWTVYVWRRAGAVQERGFQPAPR